MLFLKINIIKFKSIFSKCKMSNKNKSNNKRKTIEVYFILYLCALVMVITSSKDDEAEQEPLPTIQKTIEFPFTIKAEKPILICRILQDSVGHRIVTIDSLNVIWDIGDVENIRYEFVVEDQSLRHSVKLSSNDAENKNKYFSFVEDKVNRMAVFHWMPEIYLNENKTFIVYVTATANDNRLDGKRISAKTQFSLVITNDNLGNRDNVFTGSGELYSINNNINVNDINNANNAPLNQSQNYFFPTSEISIKPKDLKIKGIVADDWENEIFCYGFSPRLDLVMQPVIKVQNIPENNGCSANIAAIKDNLIIIKGKIPNAGHSKIYITVTRRGDLKEITQYFDVYPVSVEAPDFPTQMYPEIAYTFNPKLSSDIGEISIYIKENNNIRFSTFQGNAFKFIPDISDTGKRFSFEIYVNGKLLGQKYQIRVLPFPNPEITSISKKSKNEAIIEVTSFGLHNGKDNNIMNIEITGNGKYSAQLYGKSSNNTEKLIFKEQYSITPLDATKPFKFKAIAIDQRGYRSQEYSYQTE